MHRIIASDACVCNRLRKAARSVTRIYDAALENLGLTITQFSLLRNVEREPGVPLSRLAERMVMDRSTLYRAIAPMVDRGWLEVDRLDHRTKIVTATPAGLRLLTRAVPQWQVVQNRVGSAMGAVELQRLLDGLGALGTAAAEQGV